MQQPDSSRFLAFPSTAMEVDQAPLDLGLCLKSEIADMA
jgi:hypothetical protein